MKTFRFLAALLSALALAACEKNAVQDIAGTPPSARVRFFNFGVNAPAVHFYDGDTKLTATVSTTGSESTGGITYGQVSASGLYSGIEAGPHTFSGKLTAAGADNGRAIATLPATVEDGKHYSVFLSGFYNTTAKTVDGFIVEDPFIEEFDYSQAYVRFVNAISNAEPMTLTIKERTTLLETVIGGPVAYKSASAFVPVAQGNYDLTTRYTGSTTAVITRTAVSFVRGRIYTIGARGDITVTSTTATNRPFLDNTINR